ncbi:MAG: porin [Gammaproteobacteria bacterium]
MLKHMGRVKTSLCILGFAGGALVSSTVSAGTVIYEEGETAVEIGGRIQVQYLRVDPDTPGADSTDDLFLRRVRPEIEATLTENFLGVLSIDFADDEVDIKDAYIEYGGLPFGDIIVGNHYVPFSREQLTSSKRQQFVERTFIGDHDFGVPDRNMGVSLQGGEMLQYAVGYYKAGIDPGTSTLDFDTRLTSDTEYFGDMFAGRVDIYPLGEFDLAQGDFERSASPKIGAAINGFTWNNDDDNVNESDLPAGSDYDEAQGYGADAALRWAGVSVDIGYNTFKSETVDPTFTDGLIAAGEGDFDTYAVKGGYMIPVGSDYVEPVIGYQVLDADAVAEKDERYLAGINYFFNEYDDKLQFTYERGTDIFATDNAGNIDANETAVGDDQDRLYLQYQHLF